MSVLCPLQSIIVRKIPNSRRDALACLGADLPVAAIARVVAPGTHRRSWGYPLLLTAAVVGGMMMTMMVMTIAGALRNARLRSPPRPTARSDIFGRFRSASFLRDRQPSGSEVLPRSYSPDQSHQKYHQSCSIKAAASAFRVPTPWSTMSLQYEYCSRAKSSASPRVFGLRRTRIFTTS